LARGHEDKTPAERRWKWVLYERIPEDMRQYIKPPANYKQPKKDKKKEVNLEEHKEEKKQSIVDPDLNF